MQQKKLRPVVQLINQLASEGKLGHRERDQIAKAMKDLSHALSTRNIKKVEKAIEKICKILLIIK